MERYMCVHAFLCVKKPLIRIQGGGRKGSVSIQPSCRCVHGDSPCSPHSWIGAPAAVREPYLICAPCKCPHQKEAYGRIGRKNLSCLDRAEYSRT